MSLLELADFTITTTTAAAATIAMLMIYCVCMHVLSISMFLFEFSVIHQTNIVSISDTLQVSQRGRGFEAEGFWIATALECPKTT